MKRTNIFISIFSSILMTLISCSTEHKGIWIETVDNGTKIWLSQADSTLTYRWDGETFDSIVHGNGTLIVMQNDSVIESRSCNAYYGSLTDDDIVMVNEEERYVGNVSEEKFNGYGVYYKNGDIYVGTFTDSKPHGFVSWYRASKPYYIGHWDNGSFHGEGTLYKEDGTVKSGDWEHGKLIQTLADVKLKEGHYNGYVKNNKPDGLGKMEYANGALYSGKWKEGKYNGQGVLIQGNDTISSHWLNGVLNGDTKIITSDFSYSGGYMDGYPHGLCNVNVPDVFSYVGFMDEGEKSGYGELSYPNGDSYHGDWDHNLFDGDGIYIYANDKASYEGQWYQGLQDGIGYYRSPRFAYRGEWEEGWINGYGKMVFTNKDSYVGNFVENRFYGEGNYLFSNGNKYSGEFIDGKFNGLGTFYFANGDTYVGEFKDGKIFGDGTLTIFENGKSISITANWKGDNKIPSQGSILFSNGDIYEGELINGVPTTNGHWTSESNIENNKSWAENANEFYKAHKDEFEKISNTVAYVTVGVAVAAGVTASVVAIVGTGGAAAPAVLLAANSALATASTVLTTVNTVTYVTSIVANTASSVQDYRMEDDEDNKKEILKNTATSLAIDAAFIVVPKVAKSSAARTTRVALSKGLKTIGKKTVITLSKNKTFGKIITIVKDKDGRYSKKLSDTNRNTVKSIVEKGKQKFQSLYLSQLIKKTKLYKTLQTIQAKGAITLSDKEFKALLENPNYIRSYIETFTGNKNNFQEFFIRLAMGNKKQVKDILDNHTIREYIDKRIRNSGEGGVHEWLMTKNFKGFLTDPKWGDDGAFLALALTKLVQKTERVIFKNGGRHPTTGVANSSESALFHKRLAKEIDSCSSKEELLVKVRKFAKKELKPEAYEEFNEIFKTIFTLKDK